MKQRTLPKHTVLKEIVKGRPLITIEEHQTVTEATHVMTQAVKGAALVTRQGQLAGIFTERDLVQRVVAKGLDPAKTALKEVMTERLVTCHPEDTHVIALQRMVKANCRHLPVVEGKKVVGIVSRRELLGLDVELLEEELEQHEPSSLFI